MLHHNLHSAGQVLPSTAQMDKDPSSLDICLGEMDNQVSRFYNATNRLERLAEKLKAPDQLPNKIQGPEAPPQNIPQDHCGKFDFQNGTFNHLNSRLEMLVEYLSKAI